MRYLATILLGVLTILAAPALAQEPEGPITDRSINAEDIATTPARDLNLKKEKIPQMLLDAQTKPYDLTDLGRCSQLAAAVGELDAILGEDFDLPIETGPRRPSPGRVAQSVVGSFMPFRGVIREITGANKQERRLESAIQAGIARRSFLKGVGQARGCRYPARAATTQDVAAYQAMLAQREEAAEEKPEPEKTE